MRAMSVETVTGSFEIHIFVEPLEPTPEQAEAFRTACQGAAEPMKALLLKLDYVGKGFVGVLQSSRYVRGAVGQAREAAARDAEVLRRAHETGGDATDDAGLVERAGGTVVVVPGEVRNRKVTDRDDLVVLEAWLSAEVDG